VSQPPDYEVVEADLTAFTPDPENANLGSERGAEVLDHSLRTYGAGRSILVDRDGVVVAGNKTQEAALAAGLDRAIVVKTDGTRLVVVQRTDLDLDGDDRARALAYADNRAGQLGLVWDVDRLLSDVAAGVDLGRLFSPDEIADLVGQVVKADKRNMADAGADTDRAAELQAEWGTQAGQLWELGDHRLACGDCTDPAVVEALFDGGKPDCLLTDPPYCSGGFQEAGKRSGSIGTTAKVQLIANDTLSTRGYMALMKAMLTLCPAGVAYIFTDWRMWVNLFDAVESSGYGVRNMVVWDKGAPGLGQGWRSQHELIMAAMRVTQPFDPKKAQGNVIQCDRTGNPNHPTEKPVALLEKVLDVTDMAETVYDPFAGSGSTLIACERLGRKGRALDLEPAFVAVALDRWARSTGRQPRLLGMAK